MDPTLDKVVWSPRLAARRLAVRRSRRRHRRRVALGVLLAAALVAGGVTVSRSLLFDLSRIQVVGTSALAPADVVGASGLTVGQSVLGLDLDAIAARIEELPGVREARVEREGSLGVRITVIERAPAVQVRTGERRWFLDADGQPVTGIRPDTAIPVIRVARAPGVGAVIPRGATAAVLEVWEALPERIRDEVHTFTLGEQGALRARIGRADVVFGSTARLDEKITALGLVLDRVEQEGRRLIALDLRAPERPAARIA